MAALVGALGVALLEMAVGITARNRRTTAVSKVQLAAASSELVELRSKLLLLAQVMTPPQPAALFQHTSDRMLGGTQCRTMCIDTARFCQRSMILRATNARPRWQSGLSSARRHLHSWHDMSSLYLQRRRAGAKMPTLDYHWSRCCQARSTVTGWPGPSCFARPSQPPSITCGST